MSQEAFAAAVAKSVDTISAIERGISFTSADYAGDHGAGASGSSLGTLFEDGAIAGVRAQRDAGTGGTGHAIAQRTPDHAHHRA